MKEVEMRNSNEEMEEQHAKIPFVDEIHFEPEINHYTLVLLQWKCLSRIKPYIW